MVGRTFHFSTGILAFVLATPAAPYCFAHAADQSLDVVVVTAQRRPEDQQNVPISVSSISGEELSRRQIRTLEDLSAYTPGLTTTNTVSYGAAPLSIRGIGGANGGGNFFNDEPVAVYIDGIYISRLSTSTAELVDVESIQVLRGPQGTLYGRNSTAGALLITSNAPTDELSAELYASIARFDEYRARGVLNGPIGQNILARAAIGYTSRKGYGHNTFNGEAVGGGEDLTARLSLRFEPSERVSIDLIGMYQDRYAEPALLAVTDVSGNGVASPFVRRADLAARLDAREFELNDVNITESTTWSITGNTRINLGPAVLEMVTGVRDWSLDGVQDSDSTGLRLFTNNGTVSSRQVSNELRLISASQRPFSWVVGGIYLHDDSDVAFGIQNFQGLFGLGTDAAFGARQENSAYAFFADATYEATDRLALTMGGRYSHERKSFENNLVVSVLNGGSAPTFMGGATFAPRTVFSAPPTFTSTARFDDFSPRAILHYKASDSVLLFAGFSQGFKSGGFNSFGLTPAFGAEYVNAYEIGIKSEAANRRWRINASAFIYDYKDLQIRLPVPTGGVDIQNIAEATIKGVELEGSALFSKELLLSVNFSILDTEIIEGLIPAIASDTGPFPIGAPLPLTLEDVSGNRLTRAPSYQGAISIDYERPIGALALSFSANYRFQDDILFLETNQDTDTYRNAPWGELGLRTAIASRKNDWEMAFFLRNALDNRHIAAVTALGGFPNAAINGPRTWGWEITARF